VFKVVTDRNPDFYYVGASSQIEIAFRDYMNWVVKGKAPKAIQEEADRHNRNSEIFRFEVLEEIEGGRAELNERKKKWIERLANNQPETEQELTVEERNRLILERLAEGKSVAEVAEEFGISKSTVYNVRNSQ
jgi:DNA-binding NarL/FixJ family response regulator